jgi:ABC-type multidrug transport system ATPase subunit
VIVILVLVVAVAVAVVNHDDDDDDDDDHLSQEVLTLLELKPIQDEVIGPPQSGLSMEQRKRVTIAVELCASPSILFLDEPTSGE